MTMRRTTFAKTATPLCFCVVALVAGGAADGTPSAPAQKALTIKLKPKGGSGVSGTATLTSVGESSMRVVVRLNKPVRVRGSLLAHLHIGTCKVSPNLNLRAGLNNVVRGRSTTLVDFTPWATLRARKHSIHVHAPDYAVIACGDVPRQP